MGTLQILFIIITCSFFAHLLQSAVILQKKKLTMEMKLYLNKDVHQDSVHIWYNLTPHNLSKIPLFKDMSEHLILKHLFLSGHLLSMVILKICTTEGFMLLSVCFNGHSENLHNWRIHVLTSVCFATFYLHEGLRIICLQTDTIQDTAGCYTAYKASCCENKITGQVMAKGSL